jgi:WD40 repeat protein
VEALWRSPTARILPIAHNGSWGSGSFSPDGRHLAVYTFSEFVLLFTEDGGAPRELGGFKAPASVTAVSFTPDGSALVTWAPGEPTLRMVSVPDGREIRVFRPALPDGRPGFLRDCDFLDRGMLFHVAERATDDALVHLGLWPYDEGPHTPVGAYRGGNSSLGASVDRRGLRLALSRGARALVRPLAGDERTSERDIGLATEGGIAREVVDAGGDRLAVAEGSGRLTVWSLDSRSVTRLRELRFANADGDSPPTFDPSGSLLSWGSSADKQVVLWDLSAPPDAAPRLLRRSDTVAMKATSFHPSGDWLAVFNYDTAALWAIRQPWARVLRESTGLAGQVAFTRDSRRLLSCGERGLHLWPLDPGSGAGQQRISPPGMLCYGMALSPEEREVLWGAVGNYGTRLSGGATRCLLRAADPVDEVTGSVAIDRSGRWAAVATAYSRPPGRKRLRIFDWPSGRLLSRFPLAPPGEPEEKWDGSGSVVFDSQGGVIVAGGHGVRRFDVETGASTWIRKTTAWAMMAASRDAGQLFVLESAEWTGMPSPPVRLALVNPGAGTERPITSHGTTVMAVAIDPTGRILVSGDAEGVVRVGRADGSEPHLLLGHGGSISNVAVSPDGKWVASSSGGEIRVWPMPDLSKPPLQTLPYEELMAKLRSFTNLRVVEDPASATGYRLDIGPFPGWKDVPTW